MEWPQVLVIIIVIGYMHCFVTNRGQCPYNNTESRIGLVNGKLKK